jgi:hypothetical protein
MAVRYATLERPPRPLPSPHCCTCINLDDFRIQKLAALTTFHGMIET